MSTEVSRDLSWTEGFERRELAIGGGTVSWLELTEATGDGFPFVLVHGMQGSALEHCALGRLLGGVGPVHIPELRAHGHSSSAPTNPVAGSMADEVDLVATFVREVVGHPVVLVGNSFGAMICANVARTAPDVVHRLVLIGPAIRPFPARVDPVRLLQLIVSKPQWVHDRFDTGVREGTRPEDPDTLIANATPYLDLVPDAYRQALKADPEPAWSIEDPDGRASLWRARVDALRLMSSPRRWRNLLRGLTPPTLWLHGADDPLMRPATRTQVQAQLPRWQVETCERTGHVPQLERPEWTAERILAWLGTARS